MIAIIDGATFVITKPHLSIALSGSYFRVQYPAASVPRKSMTMDATPTKEAREMDNMAYFLKLLFLISVFSSLIVEYRQCAKQQVQANEPIKPEYMRNDSI